MRFTTSVSVLAAFVALVCGTVAFTQETKTDGTATKAASTKELKGRLPANIGKLELTTAQRQKIYGIQAEADAKIEVLAAQIKELQKKRDAEIEATLTPDQKKKLEEIRLANKEKAEQRKKELDDKKKASEAEKNKAAGLKE
jgi:Spy/CpxP family protein refolding chaperone